MTDEDLGRGGRRVMNKGQALRRGRGERGREGGDGSGGGRRGGKGRGRRRETSISA